MTAAPAAETFLKPKLLVNSSYLPPEIKFLNLTPFFTSIEKIIELDLSNQSKKEFQKSVEAVEQLVKKCKKLLV